MQERPRLDNPKPLVGKSDQEVERIKDEYFARLENNPNIAGLGRGTLETETSMQNIIQVYLVNKPSQEQLDAMEKNVEGVPLVYTTTGEIEFSIQD